MPGENRSSGSPNAEVRGLANIRGCGREGVADGRLVLAGQGVEQREVGRENVPLRREVLASEPVERGECDRVEAEGKDERVRVRHGIRRVGSNGSGNARADKCIISGVLSRG